MGDDALTAQDVAVYRYFLEESQDPAECARSLSLNPEQLDEHIVRLMSRHLLRPSLARPGGYEAASPGLAAAELTATLQAQAYRLIQQTDATRRELSPLNSIYQAHQRKQLAGASTEVIRDSSDVRSRLIDLSLQVQTKVLAAHPTLGPPETLDAAFELDRDLLERGVEYRTVVPHTARRQREALQHIMRLQERGARMRSAVVIPGRMILLDGTAALVSLGAGGGAALFRDPTVVDFLGGIFEHIWEHAKPFDGGDYDADVFEDIEITVLRQLAEGRSDEYISRRLGISTRTLRRYLADICEKLGVETRFQLGLKAARLQLLDDDESVLADE